MQHFEAKPDCAYLCRIFFKHSQLVFKRGEMALTAQVFTRPGITVMVDWVLKSIICLSTSVQDHNLLTTCKSLFQFVSVKNHTKLELERFSSNKNNNF